MQVYYMIIFYVGAVQGVILTIFLWSLKHNKISNRILGLLTSCWGILLFTFGIQFEGFFLNYPHFLKTISHIPLLFFPLLYLSAKYLITRKDKIQWIDYLHFLPFIISILLWINFYKLSGDEKIELLGSRVGYFHVINYSGDIFLALQGIIYSIVVLYIVKRYSKEVKNHISNTDKVLIRGIERGTTLLLISWITGSVAVALELFKVEVSVDLFFIVYLLIVIVIYWISYQAIKSPEIFKLDRRELYDGDQEKEEEEEDAALEKLNEQLITYIQTEKPYLEQDLSLQDLSDMIGISRHHLSILINKKHRKNFYEFINNYRVEEVKRLLGLPENKNYKIMSLAYDAGFNSKASFHRVFKQFTNMTPSEYISG